MSTSAQDREDSIPTIAEAIATAEAWNERAALLSTMAFEPRTVFAPSHDGGPPPYLIQRIGGGASPVSLAVLEGVRAELFVAAEQAREEARKILASSTDAPADGHAPGLMGSDVAPTVDCTSIKVPTGGDEIVGNPECPRARQKLGSGVGTGLDEERGQPETQAPVLRAVERAVDEHRGLGHQQTASRTLRTKARTR